MCVNIFSFWFSSLVCCAVSFYCHSKKKRSLKWKMHFIERNDEIKIRRPLLDSCTVTPPDNGISRGTFVFHLWEFSTIRSFYYSLNLRREVKRKNWTIISSIVHCPEIFYYSSSLLLKNIIDWYQQNNWSYRNKVGFDLNLNWLLWKNCPKKIENEPE